MCKIRSFLEQNKIFFETIAAISLTVMSVVVSIKSNKIASEQNTLTELSLQPYFDVYCYRTEFDSLSFAYKQEYVDIKNNAGKVSNVETHITSFIRCYYNREVNYYGMLIIPIDGLYYDTYCEDVDVLIRHQLFFESKDVVRFLDSIVRVFDKYNTNVSSYPESFLMIEYVDFKQQNREQLYQIKLGKCDITVDEKENYEYSIQQKVFDRFDLSDYDEVDLERYIVNNLKELKAP